METPKLNLVFDIDETLLHSILDKNKMFEFLFSQQSKSNHIYEHCPSPTRDFIIVFRPGLRQFFAFLEKNKDKINVGLWTYGSKEYAELIHNCLSNTFGDSVPLNFVYSVSEIEDDLHSGRSEKDLRRVYESVNNASHLNTILIDNRAANIYHDINYQNGYIVESFAPLNPYYDMTHDFMFLEIEYICNAFFHGWYRLKFDEPIFSVNNVRLLRLDDGHHLYNVKDSEEKHILSSMRVDEDVDFKRIHFTNIEWQKKYNTKHRKKKRKIITMNPMRNRRIRINKTKRITRKRTL